MIGFTKYNKNKSIKNDREESKEPSDKKYIKINLNKKKFNEDTDNDSEYTPNNHKKIKRKKIDKTNLKFSKTSKKYLV